MEVIYAKKQLEKICTNKTAAKKYFGGSEQLAISLLSRINALKASELKDIIVQPQFYFHQLVNKNKRNLEGYFAINVKTRKDPWRIIVELLDENVECFVPCDIDKIVEYVRIVRIEEVSKHYE